MMMLSPSRIHTMRMIDPTRIRTTLPTPMTPQATREQSIPSNSSTVLDQYTQTSLPTASFRIGDHQEDSEVAVAVVVVVGLGGGFGVVDDFFFSIFPCIMMLMKPNDGKMGQHSS